VSIVNQRRPILEGLLHFSTWQTQQPLIYSQLHSSTNKLQLLASQKFLLIFKTLKNKHENGFNDFILKKLNFYEIRFSMLEKSILIIIHRYYSLYYVDRYKHEKRKQLNIYWDCCDHFKQICCQILSYKKLTMFYESRK